MTAKLTHAQFTRLVWIDARLAEAGRLNRSDIMAAFKISLAQAATDIGQYKRLNPRRLDYSSSTKTYHCREGSAPAFRADDRLAIIHAVAAVTENMTSTRVGG